MSKPQDQGLFSALLHLVRWVPVCVCAGVLAGSASALLLVSLDWATRFRESHLWMIALLAPAGLAVGYLYKFLAKSVEAGNNLIIEEIHEPRAVIPLRMTPLILLGTFLTHLFGGSAGREGTAVQTGGSLADQLARPFRLLGDERRILLMAGVSGGFASVFGTPLAGGVFGIEVLAIGMLSYEAIGPCFLTAFIADQVTRAWHVHHTIYKVTELAPLNAKGMLSAVIAGTAFGLVALMFSKSVHGVGAMAKRYIQHAPLRPFVGGLLVSAAVFALHTTKYIGLGVPTIVASFSTRVAPWDFAGKFVFTVVTLGAGFKGGEVTPLFFIGATMGNALSWVLPLPFSLLAAMGFVAVFAGAANTPIASTLMAMELFGPEAGAFAGIACVVSYLFSGNHGIYLAQRMGRAKHSVREEKAEEEAFSQL